MCWTQDGHDRSETRGSGACGCAQHTRKATVRELVVQSTSPGVFPTLAADEKKKQNIRDMELDPKIGKRF